MNPIEVNEKNILAAERMLATDTPIAMLNLVTYNTVAMYEDPSVKACTGREAYLQRYAPAFREVAAAEKVDGISVLYLGSVAASIVAPPDQHWDAIALVRYPSFAALRRVIESPLYKARAEPHRKAALRAWQFMVTVQSH
jgi:hypothetical protein